MIGPRNDGAERGTAWALFLLGWVGTPLVAVAICVYLVSK